MEVSTFGSVGKSEPSPLLARRGGAKRRGGGSSTEWTGIYMNLTHHPVCGFAAATPPGQEGRWL